METPHPPIKPELLQELFLLKRETAIAKLNTVFDGQLKELCLRTVFPKQVPGFISACLAQRGELESGAGNRCMFVPDRATWLEICKSDQPKNQILIADSKLGFESAREELLPLARSREHAVIYSLTNPRPDRTDVVVLNEPKEYDVREVLKKHELSARETERLARQSNGNIYLLTCLLTGTTGRPLWANDDTGYQLRCLALIGAWNDASELDRAAVGEIVGEPYEAWVQRVYPLTKKEEPPVLLDGKAFNPVSRYETWQQLAPFLSDGDLIRFRKTAVKILHETAPELELPKEERHLAGFREHPQTYTEALKKGVAETLALLGAKGRGLPTSPNLAERVAGEVVFDVLAKADWKRWATLSSFAPQLAEAAPAEFLSAVEAALLDLEKSPIKEVFASYGDPLFSRNYHAGLLWALEVLAWSSDYLSRVATALARLARFPLPQNVGNNPLATLRAIFLTWLPQTLASVDGRKAAVQCVIDEDQEIGWKLLLDILPEKHSIGNYNQKPHWRDDWFPADWSEGVTRSEMYRQVKNYAELAVQLAMDDLAKLIEVIGRWDHMPREVFQKVLDYLESSKAQQRSEVDRFALWQKLADEVDRHRKYADSDWAMPEDDVQRLEHAAQVIKPANPAVIHQRLFNETDSHFFVGKDYRAEAKRIAELRTDAVAEILKENGPGYFLEMAKAVKLPTELGGALGRLGRPELDQLLLPDLLDADAALADLTAGYVWARYFAATIEWAKALDMSRWRPEQIGTCFARLPFEQDVWTLAEARLGERRREYWSRVWANPYQAREHLLEAAQKSLDNGRPDFAVSCLNAMHHLEEQIPTALATTAMMNFIKMEEPPKRVDQHELLEIIKTIQEAPDANENDVSWIEFQCLRLLDRFSSASPIFLERRMANVPAFFHEVITICFKSEHDVDKKIEPDPAQKARAEQTFGLLHNWKTPPGTTREHTLDQETFAKWFADVRGRCEESGHWAIAQQMIGKTLMYAPAGLIQMLELPVVAKTLDVPEHDHLRRGLRMELFNSRGVHGFSGGKDELKLAEEYRTFASKYDLATYPRIATMLRGLEEGYVREAEREARRDPYSD